MIEGDDLSIDDAVRQSGAGPRDRRKFSGPVQTFTGPQHRCAIFHAHLHAVPVELDLMSPAGARFEARPLTGHTWADLECLFDLPGGSIVRGCWCMYFRRSGSSSKGEFESVGAERKHALGDLVDGGVVPGLIGYLDGAPAGWISLGPREGYAKLRRSQIMKPVDDTACWSVICTYVPRQYRGQGLQHKLLAAAIDYARASGATVLESYPVDQQGKVDPNGLFFGSRELYARAGFTEVVRRSPTRLVMRLTLSPP